jgi:hypothetical protein
MPAVTNEDECDEIKNGVGSHLQKTHAYPMIYTVLYGTEILHNFLDRNLPLNSSKITLVA